MSQIDTTDVSRELLDALDNGKLIASVADRHPGFDLKMAYEVAAQIATLRCARGERPMGRKIGFTNRKIWPEYGATAPIWGCVYDRTLHFAANGRATLSLRGAVQPRIESEIAFKVRRPIAPGLRDPAKMLEAIEWFCPSFEIIVCHFKDWKLGAADGVADFGVHWRLIIGTPHQIQNAEIPALADALRDCEVILRRDGAVMGRGVGANALDHPALALAHLADLLAKQPQFAPLAPGEVITTGTLTQPIPIKPGETWTSEYIGLPVTGLRLALID